MTERTTMGGKPVHFVDSRVLNMTSGFAPKLLCDGPTFTAGTACQYRCSFCYVPAVMRKSGHVPEGASHFDVVVRRSRAVETLYGQLTDAKGRPKYDDPNDCRVIYSSPLVDVAANMELVRETVELCKTILSLTHWQIRLLSKSNLLPKVAEGLGGHRASEEARARVIYGVSTGTLDDKLAQAFEEGCPLVSKRIQSLHWLQDNGFRTFGMVCPSLPLDSQEHYDAFASECAERLRYKQCEHVWAEVINLRGESFTRTVEALENGGFISVATGLRRVSNDRQEWERYARETYLAHARHTPLGKLRFLQYTNKTSEQWWRTNHVALGGVVFL